MKKQLSSIFCCLGAFLLLGTESHAQINLLQDYVNNHSAAIGTFKAIDFREGGFSSMYPIANTNGKEFWVISDRGVNVDCANANLPACRPKYDKLYAFPTYAPKIHRVRLNGDSIQILQTITIKRPNGTTATGVLNPTGFGSKSTEEASMDTVTNCVNLLSKQLAKDIWAIDSEGLVVDAAGNFWISEEGGPTIWKLNPNGVVIKRFTPYANLPGAQPEDVQIDTVFKYRKNNRGFESLAMTPNGKLYAIIQSPLLFPNQTIGDATRVHRILEIDPVTNATRVLVYLNDGLEGTSPNQIRLSDWKIGDMAAINNNEFLVIEAATRGTTDVKRIYKINISGATAVTSSDYSGTSVEGLVDAAGLSANSITPVTKTLFLDLKANGWPTALDKSEGIAIINDSTIAVGNDNDYGQSSSSANGLPTATGNKSHILKYGLKGSNKIANYEPVATSLMYGITGPSTASSPYMQPAVEEAKFTSVLTVGESVGGYKMVGTPDGTGAFDNGDGTFTLLVNHELRLTQGTVRAHGNIGAFVSKWVINKSDLSVKSGEDLIKNLKLWNGTGYTTHNAASPAPAPIGRLCSADLPEVSAFYNTLTGLGTLERIFMNGEEDGTEGRAFGHIVTGPEAGTSYQLPDLGRMNYENAVASPFTGDKTVVVGLEDATPAQVYVYVGTKTNTGTDVDKAGLTNGKLYGIAVTGLLTESNASVPAPGTTFTMVDLGSMKNTTGATLQTNSDNGGVTTFLRPEDGAWDPSNPNDFYFVTTASFSEPSRMWRLRFTDVTNPELGGTITAVLDGTEGQINLDNIAIDQHGHILAQEDVGNNAHIGKLFQYTIATDELKLVGTHDETRFLTGGANFLTQDEESSGIIDVQNILGAGHFMLVDQAHYAIPGELVEGGQIMSFYNPDTYKASVVVTGPSTSQSPYLIPSAQDVSFTSILTVGDMAGTYPMAGLPDGLGAYDNNNGTFTLLMNHEMNTGEGAVHAHGSKGAFVSKWVINKSDLSVVSGSDLIQTVNLWNTGTSSYTTGTTAFGRFCSADLPEVSAFYNSATGLGTQERIFMNGEETGNEGRAFGHIATGANAGVSYELPALGKFSWENSVASPTVSNKTVVAGMDDATPGQVYFYVGTKTNTGTEVDKAGLTNGKLYGVSVASYLSESNASIPAAGTAFSLIDLGDVRNMTGATLQTNSATAGVTAFLRPEDGAWDPSNKNDFYFVTTNGFSSPSRLWRLRFTDAANPELGGTIEAVLDGTEGQIMLDNLTIDGYGHVLMQEDVGGNAHLGKTWQYTIATDALKEVGTHDETRFITGGANFLTQDEETSGIIDMEKILGPGHFIVVDQAHYAIPGDLVQGGQLLSFYNPDTYEAASVITGPSTSTSPYLIPSAEGVEFTSILTVGEMAGTYPMAGLPDGLGAYDNNNGTFTLLMNHEMNTGEGAVHAHGSKGAFVSKWVINKSDLSVVAGSDLIQTVNLWNTGTSSYTTGTTAFGRFCSADLPEVSAFYNSATGLGTQERIFMNGEETGNEGRAFGHIATGANAGVSYELPALGKFSWENSVASPTVSNKTVVVGLDDATPGQVYFYIGTKTNTGTEVDKAGLTNGKLYGVSVASYIAESNASIPAAGTAFSLIDLGDVRNMTGATLNTNSTNAGVTTFLRPEDGAWDPSNKNDFYFVTTNGFSSPSRLWRLRFTDAANPELGGTITAVLDGTEGQIMLDNLTIDGYGHVLMQEDVGSNVHLGKTWQYTIATDALKEVGTHDETRFVTGGANFLTIDEEASGIIDMEKILGPGHFIVVDQAHYAIPGDLVQGGQLLSFYNPDTYTASQLVTDVDSPVLPESNVNLYPNPTGESATISIRLEKSERVVVRMFDLQGQEVAESVDQLFEPGEQKVILNTAGLSNGVYLVQVSTGTNITRIRTVVLH